jgi:anti-sigma B factor antagonist
MGLDLTTDRSGNVCVIALVGDVDVTTSPRLKDELASAMDAGCVHLIIDAEKVDFMDSSGLGVLIGALRRLNEKDGVIRIVGTQGNVLQLFKVAGLGRVFPLFSDLTEALRF